MAANKNQQRSIEARRAERRRRERRRKKRIRALLLLVLFIAVIVLIILAFASCRGKNSENTGNSDADAAVEVTPEPTADPLAPTPSPSAAALLPPPEENNDLLDIIMDIDESGAEKTAYLTFDDGPAENTTPIILDTLRRYNIKATFFMLGTSINSYPDLARRVYEEGHLIANHSNGHNYETLYATEESFMNEVQQTEDIITNITNGDHPFKLFRFPGGSYNAGDHAAEKQTYKHTLAINGFYYIDWNSLNGDAEGKKKNSQELLEYLQENLDTSASTVVLMHDAAAKTATAEGLGAIIEYLMSEGYVFKRLDEMPTPIAASYTGSQTADGGAYSDVCEDDGGSYDDGSDYSSSAYIDSSYDDESGYSDSGDSLSGGSGSSSEGGSGLSGDGSIINNQRSGSTTRTSVDGTSVTESGGGSDTDEEEN